MQYVILHITDKKCFAVQSRLPDNVIISKLERSDG